MMETNDDTSKNPLAPHPPIPAGWWQEALTLVVEGAMAADFLQGYLTCDTLHLQADRTQPAAICNIKGRVIANGWVIALPDAVGLITHRSLFDVVAKFLAPYINFSKATLRQQPLFVAVNYSDAKIRLFDDVKVTLLESAPEELKDVSADLQQRLVADGHVFVSNEVSAEFLPQMLGLDKVGAVDFSKGCYLGQEIVARAQFRGAVKRTLQHFTWSDTPPQIGSTTASRATVVSVAANGHGLQVGSSHTSS